jgi:hypothetical protein
VSEVSLTSRVNCGCTACHYLIFLLQIGPINQMKLGWNTKRSTLLHFMELSAVRFFLIEFSDHSGFHLSISDMHLQKKTLQILHQLLSWLHIRLRNQFWSQISKRILLYVKVLNRGDTCHFDWVFWTDLRDSNEILCLLISVKNQQGSSGLSFLQIETATYPLKLQTTNQKYEILTTCDGYHYLNLKNKIFEW